MESEINYKNGIKDGKVVTYYESGMVKLEENCVEGIKDGKYLEYYESGKVKGETNYV